MGEVLIDEPARPLNKLGGCQSTWNGFTRQPLSDLSVLRRPILLAANAFCGDTGGMPHRTEQADGVDASRPEWFAAFLADRGTRKPSAHTIKAYRQDFDAIAALIAGGGDLSGMPVSAITIETMRTAFAQYAETHEAASISGAARRGTCCVPTSTPRS